MVPKDQEITKVITVHPDLSKQLIQHLMRYFTKKNPNVNIMVR